MAISARCDCGRTYSLKETAAGKRKTCQECGKKFSVPGDAPAEKPGAPKSKPKKKRKPLPKDESRGVPVWLPVAGLVLLAAIGLGVWAAAGGGDDEEAVADGSPVKVGPTDPRDVAAVSAGTVAAARPGAPDQWGLTPDELAALVPESWEVKVAAPQLAEGLVDRVVLPREAGPLITVLLSGPEAAKAAVLTSTSREGTGEKSSIDWWQFDLRAGGAPKRVTLHPEPGRSWGRRQSLTGGRGVTAALSADGQRLAVIGQVESAGYEVVVFAPDGSRVAARSAAADAPGKPRGPAYDWVFWAEDRLLLGQSKSGGTPGFLACWRPATDEVVFRSKNPPPAVPTVSPDGKTLAVPTVVNFLPSGFRWLSTVDGRELGRLPMPQGPKYGQWQSFSQPGAFTPDGGHFVALAQTPFSRSKETTLKRLGRGLLAMRWDVRTGKPGRGIVIPGKDLPERNPRVAVGERYLLIPSAYHCMLADLEWGQLAAREKRRTALPGGVLIPESPDGRVWLARNDGAGGVEFGACRIDERSVAGLMGFTELPSAFRPGTPLRVTAVCEGKPGVEQEAAERVAEHLAKYGYPIDPDAEVAARFVMVGQNYDGWKRITGARRRRLKEDYKKTNPEEARMYSMPSSPWQVEFYEKNTRSLIGKSGFFIADRLGRELHGVTRRTPTQANASSDDPEAVQNLFESMMSASTLKSTLGVNYSNWPKFKVLGPDNEPLKMPVELKFKFGK